MSQDWIPRLFWKRRNCIKKLWFPKIWVVWKVGWGWGVGYSNFIPFENMNRPSDLLVDCKVGLAMARVGGSHSFPWAAPLLSWDCGKPQKRHLAMLLPRCVPVCRPRDASLPSCPLAALCGQEGVPIVWKAPCICSSFHVSENKWEFCLMHHLFSYCICQESAILLNIRIEFLTE